MASNTVAHEVRYLSNDEAAAVLKLSPRTLEKFRVIGGGPRYRKLGRRVVYSVQDLETWADARACDSTSDYLVRLIGR
jgi:predicted DNA-binding transcriptional regulator AlpA